MASDTDLILVLEDTLTSSVHTALDDLECLPDAHEGFGDVLERCEPEAIVQLGIEDDSDMILTNLAIVISGGFIGLAALMVAVSYWWPVQQGSIHTVWALRHL
jgi:hypothetical protein